MITAFNMAPWPQHSVPYPHCHSAYYVFFALSASLRKDISFMKAGYLTMCSRLYPQGLVCSRCPIDMCQVSELLASVYLPF